MKVYEMLKFGSEMLKTMSRHGILRDDYRYVDAYEQYRRMRSLGVKYETALAILAKERHISRRTLQRAFKRLTKDC